MRLLITLLFIWVSSCSSAKPKLTLEEFFNYTSFSYVGLSPNDGEAVLVQTSHRIWDRNVSEEHLHLYRLKEKDRILITTQASSFDPRWKDDFIALILSEDSPDNMNYIHLYSTRTNKLYPLPISKEYIHTYTWSPTASSIYFATRTPWSDEQKAAHEREWRDVIEYREQYRGDTIYRVDIENMAVSHIELLVNISLRVVEIVCSPDGKQLVFSTQPPSLMMEQMVDYELYSLDLTKTSPLVPVRLTYNLAIEADLKWAVDGSLFFTVTHSGSLEGPYLESQGRLYTLNVTTRQIERWATQYTGQINEYQLLQGGRGGVVLFGQLSTEIQAYTQRSVKDELVKQNGWPGSYQNIATASNSNSSTIAFLYSNYQKPLEVYVANNVNQLTEAQNITNENQLFSNRNLPLGKPYRWINEEDKTPIEGVLLYPPDKFEEKNLPLFVLIHGGPYRGDLNILLANWYKCAVMMATAGWLVLQPNYRGSIGNLT